jgi:plastocyanin
VRFRKLGWTCAALCVLILSSTFYAQERSADAKKDEGIVVINITGKGGKSKFIKESDEEQKPVVVLVGQTVRWQNKSDVTHTATEGKPGTDKYLFDTDDIKKGKSAEVRFDQKLFERAGGKPGGEIKLDYRCLPHEDSMQATLILKSTSKEGKEKNE